jgi:hypothetical protein
MDLSDPSATSLGNGVTADHASNENRRVQLPSAQSQPKPSIDAKSFTEKKSYDPFADMDTELTLPPPSYQNDKRQSSLPQYPPGLSSFAYQPQMDIQYFLHDKSTDAYVPAFLACFAGTFTFGVFGLCFLWCFNGVHARAGIYSGK